MKMRVQGGVTSFSIRGVVFAPDANGFVEVSLEFIAAAKELGLLPFEPIHFASVEELDRKLAQLLNVGESIMTAISDFANEQTMFNDRLAAAMAGISGDIKSLNDQIAGMSGAGMSAEDVALLASLKDKAAELADAAEALDDMTPPAVPVEPPV